jgi:ribosomal protein S18 acetylase RimI-like enzyme
MKQKNLKITITKALVSESQQIRKLEETVWGEEVTNKYDFPMFVRFGYVYVAKLDKKIVGAIVGYRTKKNEVYVCDLVVDRKYQRMGIGEKLYKKLLYATKGMDIVSFLDPDLGPTLRLHQKLGAKIVTQIRDPYNLLHDKSLETGMRLFVRIKNK